MPRVTPKVEYLELLLQELMQGVLRIPGFQRPFEWSPTQMEKLLESVRRQFPIGSLLIWQHREEMRSLDKIGPHSVPPNPAAEGTEVRYLLDGHQRLSTLLGSLLPLPKEIQEPQARRWRFWYNLNTNQIERATAERVKRGEGAPPENPMLVDVSTLLDPVKVHLHTSSLLQKLGTDSDQAQILARKLREVSSTFQRYSIPVNVITEASISEAVEIFSLLNTTGRKVSPDRVFTALLYATSPPEADLSYVFDQIQAPNGPLDQLGFRDLPRTVLYRATLAALGRSVYGSPWEAFEKLDSGIPVDLGGALGRSLSAAVGFLRDEVGIRSASVLPYALQVIQLSEFFRIQPNPTAEQRASLRNAIWVSSLTGAFNRGGSARSEAAVTLFREFAGGDRVELVEGRTSALALPRRFNPRSARVRAFFLFLARSAVNLETGILLKEPLARGLQDSASVFPRSNRNDYEALENRVLCAPSHRRRVYELLVALNQKPVELRTQVLEGLVISEEAWGHLLRGDQVKFLEARRRHMIERENMHVRSLGLEPAGDNEEEDGLDNDADGDEGDDPVDA